MVSLLSPKLWGALILAAVLVFSHFFAYRSGAANKQAKWDAATAQQLRAAATAEQENRRLETLRQSKVIEAQNAATKRNQALKAAAAGARTERDGLRDDLAAIRADLPSTTLEACRARVATVTQLFDQCAGAYQGVASKADGHASDALTFDEAWPR